MTFRPMPILTLFALVSLVILVLLGNWQYQRYSDKIDAPKIQEQVEASELIQVVIDRDNPNNVQQVYGFADSEPIWRRYVPGRVQGTDEPVIVMVEATGGAQPISAAISDLPETVTFDGVIADRAPSRSGFGSTDQPDEDIWYGLKPKELAEQFGLQQTPRIVEPVIMSVRNAGDLSQIRQTLNPYAFAKPIDPLPPERHFGYAITWWGIALGLIGVYVALHRSVGRLKFR